MARPPKPPAEKQNRLILLRLTAREKHAIEHAARDAGLPTATFIRQLALDFLRGTKSVLDFRRRRGQELLQGNPAEKQIARSSSISKQHGQRGQI